MALPGMKEKCPPVVKSYDATEHFYHSTIDAFGSNRCMFESNFL